MERIARGLVYAACLGVFLYSLIFVIIPMFRSVSWVGQIELVNASPAPVSVEYLSLLVRGGRIDFHVQRTIESQQALLVDIPFHYIPGYSLVRAVNITSSGQTFVCGDLRAVGLQDRENPNPVDRFVLEFKDGLLRCNKEI